MRDLNPKIASEDNILDEKLIKTFELLLRTTEEVIIPQDRCSCDGLINNPNLRVANGKTPEDILGNYTCFNNVGASVVDYLLAESPLFKNFWNFTVLEPEFDFEQTSVTTTFKILKLETEKRKLLNLTKAVNWNNARVELKSFLNKHKTKKQLA